MVGRLFSVWDGPFSGGHVSIGEAICKDKMGFRIGSHEDRVIRRPGLCFKSSVGLDIQSYLLRFGVLGRFWGSSHTFAVFGRGRMKL